MSTQSITQKKQPVMQANIQIKKKSFLKVLKKDYQLYLLVLLPIIWLIMFKYVPMYGIQIAFKKFIAIKGIWGSDWIGLANFKKFFDSYFFWTLLSNTLGISVYQLVASFPIPIMLALALNNTTKKWYKKTVQFTIYMPHFISTVVLVGIVLQFLSPKTGLVNFFFQLIGLETLNFMAEANLFKSIYVWSGVWQNAGWGTIIYLATLAGVDEELHEAAKIDGADRFRRMLHIDIPAILPTMVILLIMQTGQIMNVGFEKIYLMQNPLNNRSSEVISTYVYKIALASGGGDFSYAAAIGLFNSVINITLIMIVNRLSRKLSETSLW